MDLKGDTCIGYCDEILQRIYCMAGISPTLSCIYPICPKYQILLDIARMD
jgi:hypothetical protein